MNLTAMLLTAAAAGVGQPDVRQIEAGPHAGYTAYKTRVLEFPIEYTDRKRELRHSRLLASTDGGGVWAVVAQATPDKPALKFTAPADGEYWVMMEEVYLDGHKVPADPRKAPPDAITKLLVDTAPPVVRVTALRRDGDEVVVEWKAEDDYLDDAASQVLFKAASAPDSAYQPVPPDAVNGARRTARFRPGTADEIVVLVKVFDEVGHGVGFARRLAAVPAERVANFLVPAAPVTPAVGPGSLPLTLPIDGPRPPAQATPSAVQPAVVPEPTAPAPPALAPIAPVAVAAPSPASPPLAPAPALPPIASGGVAPEWTTPAAATPPAPVPERGSPIAWNAGPGAAAPPAAEPASGPQAVNALRFGLPYNVESGASGVHHVDLYVTRDDGRTWTLWSQHPGGENPLRVNLDGRLSGQREGEYGFRLVPVSGAGLSEGPPPAGSPPDSRVLVDVTPPTVQVWPPQPDPNQRNAVTLRWTAADANFGPSPICIEWSDQPAGPWRPVTGGDAVVPAAAGPAPAAARVANTGAFSWALPAGLNTHQVYLKFTAWDAAGNRSEAVTPRPVTVDMLKPHATIRGVVPAPGGRP